MAVSDSGCGPDRDALPVSGVSRKIDRFGVVFDDESLVADAGLVAAGVLMVTCV